jgi:hypothetical protein
MLLISQNIGKYDFKIPKDTVLRINLAWCNSLKELEDKLAENKESEFFIDLPVRSINKNPHIRYLDL